MPEDVAVVGFDDIHAAAYFNPSLTTVRQDTRAAGEMLVTHLMSLIEGEEVTSEQLSPTLVIRASCGAEVGNQ